MGKRRTGFGVGLLLLLLAACPAAADPPPLTFAPMLPVTVVSRYPHDPGAFTQGLLFHDGVLYESTGIYRESHVRKVDLATGRVLAEAEVPKQQFAEGLALFGDRLFLLSWHEGVALVLGAQRLEQRGAFRYRGEGWGITSDGRQLIMSDGSARLRFIDPTDFSVVRTLDVRDGREPVLRLNELEWVRGEIWANVWLADRIARIDPATGRVIAWLDLIPLVPPEARAQPDAVPNGIAYDAAADRIFITGKLWPVLYEIKVP